MGGDCEEWEEAVWYVSNYCENKPAECSAIGSKHCEKLEIATCKARDPSRGVDKLGASCWQVITEVDATDKVNINIPIFESHSVRRHSERFIVVYSK